MTGECGFDHVRIGLPPGVIEALAQGADHSAIDPGDVEWVREAVRRRLHGGPGFAVFTCLEALPQEALRAATITLSNLIGVPRPQDGEGTLVRDVVDRGARIGEGTARYADSRHGGSLHTDGAEAPPPPPAYFTLMCVRPAKEGGSLALVSLDDVLAALADRPDFVETLRQPFHFDRRSDPKPGEPRTVEKPVLLLDEEGESVTYLREYIDAGHGHPEVPDLTSAQRAALDALDEVLEREDLQTLGRLRSGEFAVFNNRRVLHGRTTFVDHDEPERRRMLCRTWIDPAPAAAFSATS